MAFTKTALEAHMQPYALQCRQRFEACGDIASLMDAKRQVLTELRNSSGPHCARAMEYISDHVPSLDQIAQNPARTIDGFSSLMSDINAWPENRLVPPSIDYTPDLQKRLQAVANEFYTRATALTQRTVSLRSAAAAAEDQATTLPWSFP